MGSKWRKVKEALMGGINFNLCSNSYAPINDSPQPSIMVPNASTSKALIPITESSASSSKMITCAICLGSMEAGRSRALFTAECAHAFHFHCIALNVKHGNHVCPVCRAEWKEVPLLAPSTSIEPRSGRRRDGANYAPTSARRHRRPSMVRPMNTRDPDPSCFDDDEPLDIRSRRCGSCSKTVECRTFLEFSQVRRSDSKEGFAVLINLKAPMASDVEANRAPVDLVTVLDISGSMAGTKLALLKQAMEFVVRILSPSDRLSVISFSSSARRLFNLRKMSESGKESAIQAINSLVAGGGTNITGGIKKGAKVLEDRRERNPVCSIMLLSDGQDTRPAIPRILSSNRGAPIHAFGFGADHDPERLHSISEESGGTFSFIEAAGTIQDAFARCVGGLLSVEVQELSVAVECIHPGVRIRSISSGSYTNRISKESKAGTIDVGDMYADEEKNFLVSVDIPPVSEPNTKLFSVRCAYRDPTSNSSRRLEDMAVEIQRPEAVIRHEISTEVERERDRLMAADAMHEARDAAEQGHVKEAVAILETCSGSLTESPGARSGDSMWVVLNAELKEMRARMASRQRYEACGRAYLLSGLSSHAWQRATARGDSFIGGDSVFSAYETPSMVDMVQRSRTSINSTQGKLNGSA